MSSHDGVRGHRSPGGVHEIGLPTLIVHGAADFSAPVDVTRRHTAELIPDTTYKEYPTAGHGIRAGRHAQLNADRLAFLRQ
ncbi:alpha/beta fold hydrolase [Streptomyces gilvosporeus]|uniref:alpha/beta fold hydrolase n=1 Tax=Streptomyces gilvosporeus TaxID=553510 RepID=UPI00131ADF43|nr:alpha/beta hydrolase [Streptomyces gilvosporeus]